MCEPVTLGVLASAGTYLAAPAALGTAGSLALAATAGAGAMGAAGAYQQGQVAKQVGRNNQIMAEYAAADALRRGDEQAMQDRRQGDQMKGAQRARMAASGLDLGEGTAGDLQDQTDFFSAVDQTTSRQNAKLDAWASRAQGANARAQGDAAARQGNLSAFSTLLGTGGQVADKWLTYKAPASAGDGLSQGDRRKIGVY